MKASLNFEFKLPDERVEYVTQLLADDMRWVLQQMDMELRKIGKEEHEDGPAYDMYARIQGIFSDLLDESGVNLS